jgi:putative transposase
LKLRQLKPMPRRALSNTHGHVIHVHNRSVRRERLFANTEDYQAFETVLTEAIAKVPIRLLAYCVMPNHWHLVVWPETEELPGFMHWLTATHARRWHLAHGSRGTGHVYQDRYGAVPVQSDRHLLTLLRYVERNPLRANLVERAEHWLWCSLRRRLDLCTDPPLARWPILQPTNWIEHVNEPHTAAELEAIQAAIRLGRPLGDPEWCAATAERFGITMRPGGRPKTRPGLVFENSENQTRSQPYT